MLLSGKGDNKLSVAIFLGMVGRGVEEGVVIQALRAGN